MRLFKKDWQWCGSIYMWANFVLRVPKIVVLRFCVSYILLVSFLDVEMYLFSYSRGFFFKRTYCLCSLSFCEYIAGTRDFSLLFWAGPLGIKTRRGETGTEESQKRLYLQYWRQERERELENKVVEETRRQGFIYTPTKWQAHTQWHRDLYIYLPGRRPSSCTSRSLVFS